MGFMIFQCRLKGKLLLFPDGNPAGIREKSRNTDSNLISLCNAPRRVTDKG